MYSELELEYKMAEDLIESEISILSDLPKYIDQCTHLLKNPLIWANMELTDQINERRWEAVVLLCNKEENNG